MMRGIKNLWGLGAGRRCGGRRGASITFWNSPVGNRVEDMKCGC